MQKGRYKFQSIVPHGYGVPPGSPTEKLLSALGRHGQRPAHIHFFISADGHRKLTTQINIEGDPLINDDFAYATRDGLVPAVIERTDEASIEANSLNGSVRRDRIRHPSHRACGRRGQSGQRAAPARCGVSPLRRLKEAAAPTIVEFDIVATAAREEVRREREKNHVPYRKGP